ncbi:hypothetical protein ACO0RG_002976 [Hanseniaspora osmophila]|uniref:Endoplasmic reticulum oxidoreductin-1 n=1 Tax=Hanseniaspora osmophila TaxID=56408 RepID=A0A1E5RZE3_9ASCO|nr:Endoplasmic reticulum oxidoreductin-1 [Hanseniaspora osmophila]
MKLTGLVAPLLVLQQLYSVLAAENTNTNQSSNTKVNTTNNNNNNNNEVDQLSDNTNFCKVNKDDLISETCDVTFHEINEMNAKIRPILKKVVGSDFFKYFKLNLYTECPFWEDNNGYCVNRACAVDIIEDNWDQLPEYWQPDVLGQLNSSEESMIIGNQTDDVQEEFLDQLCKFNNLNGNNKFVNQKFERDIEYCDVDTLTNHENAVLVDLTANPERFTGYGGEQSGMIWGSIYRENCFSVTPEDKLGKDPKCLAKDAFYRLVSGMHASIATHLSNDFLDTKTGKWGPNLELFMNRVGYFPDRVANIYFNYAVVSKAVYKISGYLKNLEICEAYDENVTGMIDQISSDIDTRIFNENLLFQNDISSDLKDQFRTRFKNVTKIMDCVHCDRCRLWGKVQTTGYATSLKILFEMDEFDAEEIVNGLTKYELIALFNTYDRISKSVESINNFEKLYHQKNEGFFQRNNIFKLLDRAKKQWLTTSSSISSSITSTLKSLSTSADSEAPIKASGEQPAKEDIEEEKFQDLIMSSKKKAANSEPAKGDNRSSLRVAWDTEINNVKEALKFIFKSYIDLPKNMGYLLLRKMNSLWNSFIGVENYFDESDQNDNTYTLNIQ